MIPIVRIVLLDKSNLFSVTKLSSPTISEMLFQANDKSISCKHRSKEEMRLIFCLSILRRVTTSGSYCPVALQMIASVIIPT